MKILIFEYINGGGLANTELPPGLAHEGWLMLKTLLADLIASGEHELSVLLDQRCLDMDLSAGVTRIVVTPEDDVLTVFANAVQDCDAVLPIAPETEEILWTLCRTVEKSGKQLLASSSDAVEQTADKLTTFKILSEHGIPTIPSYRLDKYPHFYSIGDGAVIKARDGAGCENCFVCLTEEDFERLLISVHHPKHYVIQPFISGIALSVSALFKEGTGQLICINHQYINIHDNQRLKLVACDVNYQLETAPFQAIVDQLATVFPGLWGYIGIDLIKRDDQLLIVEINPRLTSSYVGIRDALGINVAAQMLKLIDGEVDLHPSKNQTIAIELD
jgi:tyramine---L-glutamate ligase